MKAPIHDFAEELFRLVREGRSAQVTGAVASNLAGLAGEPEQHRRAGAAGESHFAWMGRSANGPGYVDERRTSEAPIVLRAV